MSSPPVTDWWNCWIRFFDIFGSVGTSFVREFTGMPRKYKYSDQSDLEGKSDIPAIWLSMVDVPPKQIPAFLLSGHKICQWDITEQLKKIGEKNVPFLLIHGMNDQMVRCNTAEYIQNLVGENNCVVEKIPDAKHSMPLQKPDDVIKVIKDYLNA
ncbi:alpha/beta hydrolase [Candidatus Woesearchaeota archaeon]|nr:alpha/beta hydrolase [Candidatus Woesearchaeota archaeon]